jgi:hypothetical protein
MRKAYKVLATTLIGVVVAGFAACDDPVDPTDGQIILSVERLDFPAAGDTRTIDVLKGENWTATPSDTWISVTSDNNRITVTLGVNETFDLRTGAVTVRNAHDSQSVMVMQQPAVLPAEDDRTLTLYPGNGLTFPNRGNTQTVVVASRPAWTVTTEADWLTIVEGEGWFSVSAAPSTLFESRSASIVVDNGTEGEAKTLAVSQDPVQSFAYAEMGMGFYWDYYECGASNFELEFVDAAGENYLFVDMLTPLHEDALLAYIDDGTYTFDGSGEEENYEPFTFIFGVAGTLDQEGNEVYNEVTAGSFTSLREGDEYIFQFSFELDNGAILYSTFRGGIDLFYDAGGDTEVDFNTFDNLDSWAEEYTFVYPGLWHVGVTGDDSDGEEHWIDLYVNAERGRDYMPEGNFPMAAVAREWEPGTMEPTSRYEDDWIDIGTAYFPPHGLQYAMPGDGFVNIERAEGGGYNLTWEFWDPNGDKVSGVYTGAIRGAEFSAASPGAVYRDRLSELRSATQRKTRNLGLEKFSRGIDRIKK